MHLWFCGEVGEAAISIRSGLRNNPVQCARVSYWLQQQRSEVKRLLFWLIISIIVRRSLCYSHRSVAKKEKLWCSIILRSSEDERELQQQPHQKKWKRTKGKAVMKGQGYVQWKHWGTACKETLTEHKSTSSHAVMWVIHHEHGVWSSSRTTTSLTQITCTAVNLTQCPVLTVWVICDKSQFTVGLQMIRNTFFSGVPIQGSP